MIDSQARPYTRPISTKRAAKNRRIRKRRAKITTRNRASPKTARRSERVNSKAIRNRRRDERRATKTVRNHAERKTRTDNVTPVKIVTATITTAAIDATDIKRRSGNVAIHIVNGTEAKRGAKRARIDPVERDVRTIEDTQTVPRDEGETEPMIIRLGEGIKIPQEERQIDRGINIRRRREERRRGIDPGTGLGTEP